jgi:tRNA threonylcarbamoyladenosine biosynthesis protein TsaB
MNILAIETATTSCAIGLLVDGHCEVRVLDRDRRHTEVLTPGVRQILSDHGLVARDLTRVIVDRGPGLFTGLRVGIATAQALAEGTGAKIVGVTSLELLAHSAASDGVRGSFMALVDARRGELFLQSFELTNDLETLAPTSPPVVSTPAAVEALLLNRDDSVTISGDGVRRYQEIFLLLADVHIHDDVVPSPLEMLKIGATRSPSEQIVPLYLREADAVANFTTRQRAPG